MRLEAKTAGQRALSMTPLIDIIFLLLLFFMLSSTFLKFSHIDVAGGKVGERALSRSIPDIIVRVDKDGAVDVNGQSISGPVLVETLQSYADLSTKSVIVSVHEGAKVQDLVTVLDQTKKARPASIAVIR